MSFGSIFSSSDYLPKIHTFCEGPLPPVPRKEQEQEEMPAAEPQPLLHGCEVTMMLQNHHHH